MRFRNLIVLLMVCAIPLLGCRRVSSPDDAIRSVNKTNMQRLANLYTLFQFQNKFKGPANEADFRTFLSKTDPAALAKMGVETAEIDQLFICERDGEPFSIKYGVPSGPRGSTEPVVFEATGKGGKKMVGFLNMVQREVDDAEYQTLWGSRVAPQPQNQTRNLGATQ